MEGRLPDVLGRAGLIRRLLRETRGFTALEYTLITVIIGTVVLSGVGMIGNALSGAYGEIGNTLTQLANGV